MSDERPVFACTCGVAWGSVEGPCVCEVPDQARSGASMMFAEVTSESRGPAGRSTVTVCCPYCDCETEARLWSLAGSGKKCECGAIFYRNNQTGDVIAKKGKS